MEYLELVGPVPSTQYPARDWVDPTHNPLGTPKATSLSHCTILYYTIRHHNIPGLAACIVQKARNKLKSESIRYCEVVSSMTLYIPRNKKKLAIIQYSDIS